MCQENISHPIGAGSLLEEMRVSERELHNSRTSYCAAFFSTHNRELPLCKITGVKQIT